MKKVLFMAAILFACQCVSAQTINVKPNVVINIPQGKTFVLDKPKDEGTLTTNTALFKGERYPVYVTQKGRLFIKLVSKSSGKEYHKYIKQE